MEGLKKNEPRCAVATPKLSDKHGSARHRVTTSATNLTRKFMNDLVFSENAHILSYTYITFVCLTHRSHFRAMFVAASSPTLGVMIDCITLAS